MEFRSSGPPAPAPAPPDTTGSWPPTGRPSTLPASPSISTFPGTRRGAALTCALTLRTAWCCSSAPDTTSPRRCGTRDHAAAATRQLQLQAGHFRGTGLVVDWSSLRLVNAALLAAQHRWSVVASCCGLTAAVRITKSKSSMFSVRCFLLSGSKVGQASRGLRPRLGGAATPLASLDGSSLASRNYNTNVQIFTDTKI